MIAENGQPYRCCILGVEEGNQCREITEVARLVLQKAREWALPVVIIQNDILNAFDYISRGVTPCLERWWSRC